MNYRFRSRARSTRQYARLYNQFFTLCKMSIAIVHVHQNSYSAFRTLLVQPLLPLDMITIEQ